MNADGSPRVLADLDLGAKLSFLLWLAIGLLIAGALVLAASVALIVLAANTPKPPPTPPTPPTASGGADTTPASAPPDRPAPERPPS
jgi:hypothetical protein